MIFGTGIDIVEIERFRQIHSRWGSKFINRVFTKEEINSSNALSDKAPYFASRFAAKEAFVKALGTGISGGIRWTDMSIQRKKGQRPYLIVSGRASEIIDIEHITQIHLSLTHERSLAVAQVILESDHLHKRRTG